MSLQMAIEPEFLWMGETQREALASLKCGILENKAFLLITGEIGTGKTTLINNLVRNLGEEVIIAKVPDPAMNNFDFVNFITHAIRNEKEFKSKSKLLIHFSKFLNDACADDKMVLLIIDEGQRLKDLLQKILLSNIEKPDKKISNIFPLRQNKLNQAQELENFGPPQRLATPNRSLQPLGTHERKSEVIKHRLRIAGAQYDMYSSGAILAVHAISDGGPGCENCGATGISKENRTITAEIFEEPKRPKESHSLPTPNILYTGRLKGVSVGILVAVAFFATFILFETRSGEDRIPGIGGTVSSHEENLESISGISAEENVEPREMPETGPVQTEQIRIQKVAVIERQHDKEKTSTLSLDQIRKISQQQRDRDGDEGEVTLNRVTETNPAVDTPATLSSDRDASLATVAAMREMISRPPVSVAAEGNFHRMESRKVESKDILEAVSNILKNQDKSGNPKAAGTNNPHLMHAAVTGNAVPTTGEQPGTKTDHLEQLSEETSLKTNDVATSPGNDVDPSVIIDHILMKGQNKRHTSYLE